MWSTGLFLETSELFAGMTVAICLEGKQEPETDEEGPLLVKVLVGGIPNRVKLYPWPNGIRVMRGGTDPVTNQPRPRGLHAVSYNLDGVRPDVRFMPTQVFRPGEAPPDTDFVAYLNGKRLRYQDGPPPHPPRPENIVLRTDKAGRVLSNNGYVYDWWLREYPLPEGALLVPIGEVGKARDPYARWCR